MLPKHIFNHRRVIPLQNPQTKQIMRHYNSRKVLPAHLTFTFISVNKILSFPDVIGEFKLTTSVRRKRFQKSVKILPRTKTASYFDKSRSNTEGLSTWKDDLRMKYYQRINSEVSFCLRRIFRETQSATTNNKGSNSILSLRTYYENNLKHERKPLTKHQGYTLQCQNITETQFERNMDSNLANTVKRKPSYIDAWETNTVSSPPWIGISLNSPLYAQYRDSFNCSLEKRIRYPKTSMVSPFPKKLTTPSNSLLYSNTFEESLDVLPIGHSASLYPCFFASRIYTTFVSPNCTNHLYTTESEAEAKWDCKSLKRKRSDSEYFDNNFNLKRIAKPSLSSVFSVNAVGNSKDFQKTSTYLQNRSSSQSLWRTVRVELNETHEIYKYLNELESKNVKPDQNFTENQIHINEVEHIQSLYNILSSDLDYPWKLK